MRWPGPWSDFVPEPRVDRERDLDRFIDAIVAIAITLLVLPLAEVATEVGDDAATKVLYIGTMTLSSALLTLADPAVSAWRRTHGGGKGTAHMGE